MIPGIFRPDIDVIRFEGDAAALGHGLAGVSRQGQDGLLELALIGPRHSQVRFQVLVEHDTELHVLGRTRQTAKDDVEIQRQ